MTEYTEKGIIEIQRQTITQQNYAIGAHAEAISSLKSGYAMLKIIADRLARENIALNSRIDKVEQAVMDMAKTQKTNTESRKKFEAGYYGRIGE